MTFQSFFFIHRGCLIYPNSWFYKSLHKWSAVNKVTQRGPLLKVSLISSKKSQHLTGITYLQFFWRYYYIEKKIEEKILIANFLKFFAATAAAAPRRRRHRTMLKY